MAVETKEYRAEARFQRVSPQKARLVLDLVKGQGVQKPWRRGVHQEADRSGDSQGADLGLDNAKYCRMSVGRCGR